MNYDKILVAIICFSILGCTTNSKFTNVPYNSPEHGGYLKVDYAEQETGPGIVLIKGGYFNYTRNSITKEVLIPSFYMDEYEISNSAWVDYMHWTKRTFTDFPLVYSSTIPSKSVWLEEGSYNEPMANYYLEHLSYSDYPV